MAPNRLINEQSPYLIQHAHNPVDWHPWSEAAFERARAEDRPIFLSIGYATCHWCHVMERESFEDPETARHLNETFICIKVDREERPDVDAVYMAACQMLTGSGGWPLTIFMTPDRRPFFAGTYIPSRGRFNRPGLIDLCTQVRRIWAEDRDKLLDSAGRIAGHIGQAFAFSAGEGLGVEILDAAHDQMAKGFDPEHGGFGPPPKFPTPHRLRFLLREHRRTGSPAALDMVRQTLSAMRRGGIWDHLGFGFHRYSTDRQWLLPHFEKMLYDQALMAEACLDAFGITGDPAFARTADEIFTYVRRDMTAESGAFFAAEDADSEGVEGKFYVWTIDEVRAVLGPEESAFWEPIFNIRPDGNFTDEATGHRTGANIFHLTASLEDWALRLETPIEELRERWASAREALFAAREERVRPLLDDKVLTDWNGMMISAMAYGGRLLGRPDLAEAAGRAARFILTTLSPAPDRLLHRYRGGEAGIDATADDYAYFIRGLLALYGADFDPAHIEAARALAERMMADFWDPDAGGFYLTASGTGELPVRPKELYDGAIPSANTVMLVNLIRLSRLTGEAAWEARADDLIRAFSGSVKSHPSAYPELLRGVDLSLTPSREVVIAGDPADEAVQAMIEVAVAAPDTTVMLRTPENAAALARIAPFTEALVPPDGQATAFVCTGFSCDRPVTTPDALRNRLFPSTPPHTEDRS